jgi:TFIIF-interacting CTD phosphatase-like protein
MGGYYEVVLFTDEPSAYAEPIINKLDPYRWEHKQLFFHLVAFTPGKALFVRLARTIKFHGVHTVFLAGISPDLRSYTVHTYGSGQPLLFVRPCL